MATLSARRPIFGKIPLFSRTRRATNIHRDWHSFRRWVILAAVIVATSAAMAQNTPQITAVDPSYGKVNDTVTVSGNNLGKALVSSVYLSDDKSDFKAAIVEQGDEKITLKVPQVKAGNYNISLQVGDKLFIKPVKFRVQE
jgi:Rieske Fe-S protein